MGTISLQIPQIGVADTTEDVKVANNFTALQNVINGNIDSTNLLPAAAQSAAINQSGQTVKGSSIIATQQSTGSTTFTTLATPDQVTGIVLPNPGLLLVWYQARWFESVATAARADIFLNSNEVVLATRDGVPTSNPTSIGGVAGVAVPLATNTLGLSSVSGNAGYSGDVTTGQILGSNNQNSGGAVYLFAAAGTYTVSIRFKASSGTVTVDGRRLYVQAISFA